MALSVKQSATGFTSRLTKGVDPLYVFCGDEPLLLGEALDALREKTLGEGGTERESHIAERGFDWDALFSSLQNMSLFASRRLVELRLPSGKPGDDGARFLTALAGRPDTGNVIVVILPGLDSATSRSKWATALAEAAVWVDFRTPDREELPRWLAARLRRAGLDADDEALDLLASRVEGNLLAASQEIDKLALLSDGRRLDAAAVNEAVADGSRFDVFQLADAALAGDRARTVRVLRGLQREGEAEVLVLWSLVRDILLLADIAAGSRSGRDIVAVMNEARVWRSRQDLVRRALRGRSAAELAALVDVAAHADCILKGARHGEPWKALVEVALALSGAGLPSAETA